MDSTHPPLAWRLLCAGIPPTLLWDLLDPQWLPVALAAESAALASAADVRTANALGCTTPGTRTALTA